MSRFRFLPSAIAFLIVTEPAVATQPVGVYAVIDKVILEPAEGQPERIQVWGAFSIAKEKEYSFHEPARGYLYFAVIPAGESAARKEWADMKALAGSGKIVSFGNRREQKVTLRKDGDKPKDPDVYTISIGLQEIAKDNEYAPIRKLAKLVSPISPLDGEEVEPGSVTLRVREPGGKEHPAAKARFEIDGPDRAKEASDLVAPEGKEAAWKPAMELKPGKKYTWRVWAVDGDWTGPSRTATLKVKVGG